MSNQREQLTQCIYENSGLTAVDIADLADALSDKFTIIAKDDSDSSDPVTAEEFRETMSHFYTFVNGIVQAYIDGTKAGMSPKGKSDE